MTTYQELPIFSVLFALVRDADTNKAAHKWVVKNEHGEIVGRLGPVVERTLIKATGMGGTDETDTR